MLLEGGFIDSVRRGISRGEDVEETVVTEPPPFREAPSISPLQDGCFCHSAVSGPVVVGCTFRGDSFLALLLSIGSITVSVVEVVAEAVDVMFGLNVGVSHLYLV